MKVKITLSDINALGTAWEEVREKTFGKQTTKIYRALRPYIELIDDYRKAQQAYIKEHVEEGSTSIERYESMENQDGVEISDETKKKLGVPETSEWVLLQGFVQDQMSEEHLFETLPVLDETQANKLTTNQIRVFDVLGLLVSPKEEAAMDGDE